MIDSKAILVAQTSWRDSVAAGDAEASAAAESALPLLREAVVVLTRNLREMGYPQVSGLVAADSGVDALVGKIETTVGGAIPPILKAFWRCVGGISLVDIKRYEHVEFWDARDIRGGGGFCDGVHVDACTADWSKFAVQDFLDRADDPDLPPPSGPHLLSLAPDGYHKDNISGGAPYGISVGGGWLAVWENYVWPGPKRPTSAPTNSCDLLGYLRTAILECAGFPGLFGVLAFEPIREQLLHFEPIREQLLQNVVLF